MKYASALVIGATFAFYGATQAAETDSSASVSPPADKTSPRAGDGEWKEVKEAMDALINYKPTGEDTVETLKKALSDRLTRADKATEDFAKKYPDDPRRALFAVYVVQSVQAREYIGKPVQLEDHVKAQMLVRALDTRGLDEDSKADISDAYVQLLREMDSPTFEAVTKEHIAKYPNHPTAARWKKVLEDDKAEEAISKELATKPLELKFTAIDGRKVDLSELRGKVVIVDFWATWCTPCVASMPKIKEIYDEMKGKGLEVVGISLDKKDDKTKVEDFVRAKGYFWPQHFDGKGWDNEIAKKYMITGIPAIWVVNKKGFVLQLEDRRELRSNVEKLLAE